MPNMLAEIMAHKVAEIENLKLRKSVGPGGAGVPPASSSQSHTSGQDACAPRLQYSKTGNEERGFVRALSGKGLKIVAEIKPASPSAGVLRKHVDLEDIVRAYDCYASAISVLTDGKYFGSSFSVLEQVVKRSVQPVLCKDFIIDPYQVHCAALAGAQAVLLIVKVLSDEQLAELSQLVEQLGMTPVIEVQTRLELSRALQMRPEVLLINNRNLDSFEIDLSTTLELAPLVPRQVTVISASGITSRSDIERLRPVCSRFLIGSALMQSQDIEGKLKELAAE